jgi:transposase-like protein
MLLPMVAGIAATKADLTSWVHDVGMEALHVLLGWDVEELAGKKGEHREDRTHYRWGRTKGELSFGGRRVQVQRPRVQLVTGGECALPSFEAFQREDPLPERVINQILVGVSTRGYESSLERPLERVKSRGASKSAASRHLVAETRSKLSSYLSRRLEEIDLLAMMVDGIEIAGRTVVVSLGITRDGTKVPLGLWLGSTENAALCTSMLQDLLSRGLRIEGRILCVIDGGKGIRKALDDVLGDLVVVQRCRLHKIRNVQSHLPKSRHAYVLGTMREAYRMTQVALARKRLQVLVAWLESSGYDEAAASLREGLEETLTVLKLELPESLRRSLATTNAIENLMGSIRRVSRNVKRWKNPEMIRRWTALGVVTAQKRFRRIKGYREMSALHRALRSNPDSLDKATIVA